MVQKPYSDLMYNSLVWCRVHAVFGVFGVLVPTAPPTMAAGYLPDASPHRESPQRHQAPAVCRHIQSRGEQAQEVRQMPRRNAEPDTSLCRDCPRRLSLVESTGVELDTTVARPHFNGLREMEEVAGGSDARRRKRKSELRQSQLPPTTAPSSKGPCRGSDWTAYFLKTPLTL